MPPPGTTRLATRATIALGTLAAAYLLLLVRPDPLFAYVRAGDFVVVHADAPIPAAAAGVIRDTEARVQRSPLFVRDVRHDVFVCQSAWRWTLLSNVAHGSGAVAMAPIGRAIFTRPAHFERDRLVGPSGHETPAARTLAYFFAHEVTHTLTADFVGPLAYRRLPVWIREGYADYVARGAAFDYAGTRALLLAGDRTLDPHRSGLYLRYVLLVAHLLDVEGRSLERLLRAPPDAHAVEARIRATR